VKGDLHDIGKNLVRMMMEGKGLEVIDLGIDVPVEKFIETAVQEQAQIIACSALLTTTMNEMKLIVEAAKTAGIRDKVKIMIGGAPVTDQFRASIGADLYAPDAASAAEVAVQACASMA
jgi:methanogenic corrinoid protein MtbC1